MWFIAALIEYVPSVVWKNSQAELRDGVKATGLNLVLFSLCRALGIDAGSTC